MTLVVVGTVALDSVSTPFGSVERALGGSATHFSFAARYFAPTSVLAVVGEDFPPEHLQRFTERQIGTAGINKIQGAKTFHWEGRYDYDMNTAHTLATHLNVIATHTPEWPQAYALPRILFLANIDPDLQLKVLESAKNCACVAMDTMNLWIEIKKESIFKVLKQVNIFLLNEAEARALTGENSLKKCAQILQKCGPQIVVIKRGEYGALLFHQHQIIFAPALPLESVFDPTGAGDSFAGGFLGYLHRVGSTDFESAKTALVCGTVMASFNVEKFSCERLLNLTDDEIRARFAAVCELSLTNLNLKF